MKNNNNSNNNKLSVSLLPHLALLTSFQTPSLLALATFSSYGKEGILDFGVILTLLQNDMLLKSVNRPILNINALVVFTDALQKKQLKLL